MCVGEVALKPFVGVSAQSWLFPCYAHVVCNVMYLSTSITPNCMSVSLA